MTKQELLREADKNKRSLNEVLENKACQIEGVSPEGTAFMLERVREGNLEITEELLKEFHKLGSTKHEELGEYRSIAIQPEWAQHTPPAPEDLDHYMKHFIGQMNISRQMFHPIEFAAICHKRVLEIYPFKEGNEAVAMLVLNLILLGNGYERIQSFKEQQDDYLEKLIKAQHPSQPDIDGFITFIIECILQEN